MDARIDILTQMMRETGDITLLARGEWYCFFEEGNRYVASVNGSPVAFATLQEGGYQYIPSFEEWKDVLSRVFSKAATALDGAPVTPCTEKHILNCLRYLPLWPYLHKVRGVSRSIYGTQEVFEIVLEYDDFIASVIYSNKGRRGLCVDLPIVQVVFREMGNSMLIDEYLEFVMQMADVEWIPIEMLQKSWQEEGSVGL